MESHRKANYKLSKNEQAKKKKSNVEKTTDKAEIKPVLIPVKK